MADISVVPNKSGGRNVLLAIIAVVLMIALMVWLEMQEGTTAVAPQVVEDDAPAEVIQEEADPAAAEAESPAL